MNTNNDLLEVNLQLNKKQLLHLIEVTTREFNRLEFQSSEEFYFDGISKDFKENNRKKYKSLKQIQNLILDKLKYIENSIK